MGIVVNLNAGHHLTGLAAALVECRRDALVSAGSIADIAKRHSVCPHDLCEHWIDDPYFARTLALRAEAECRP